MALLERAQRQNGLGPFQAPPLAFSFHPMLNHGATCRLHDAGPHGQTQRQVRIVLHPAPVVVEERNDFRERLPDRLPQPPLGEDLSQSADDISYLPAEQLRQLRLYPASSVLGAFPAQGVGCRPQVAHNVHDIQDKRHALPRLEARGRQAPQAEGAIEQDDQGLAVLGISALHVGLDALHHLLLRPHQAGETTNLLGSRRIVHDVCPLPACARRFWIDQEFRERFGRPRLGIDGVADPHQGFLLPLPLLSGAQLRFELDRLRLDHGNALTVKTHDQELSRGGLWGNGPLRIEGLVVLRGFLRHLHQDTLGHIEVEELLEQACAFLERVLNVEQGHPLLQEVRVTPLGEVHLLVQREDPRLPWRAVAGPGYIELAEEAEVVPPSQLLLPRQDHAVGPRDGRSHISRTSLSAVELHRRQPNGQQPFEDAFLRFMRLELAGLVPGKLHQRLESFLAFRDTHLDIERFHGDPPDVVDHRNTAQMFPGFYHRRRVPLTRKLPACGTLSLNSFHVHSNAIWTIIQESLLGAGFVVADVRVLDKKQTTMQQWVGTNVVSKDLIISAYKPNWGIEERFKLEAGTEEGVWDFVQTHLRQLPVFVSKDRQAEVIAERMNTFS